MVPKSELQSENRGGTPPPKADTKWDPVFGACGKCANAKEPPKRVRNLVTQFSFLSSEFSIRKFATKRWKTSLGKFTSCVDFELAGATLEGRLDEAEIAANFGLQQRCQG